MNVGFLFKMFGQSGPKYLSVFFRFLKQYKDSLSESKFVSIYGVDSGPDMYAMYADKHEYDLIDFIFYESHVSQALIFDLLETITKKDDKTS